MFGKWLPGHRDSSREPSSPRNQVDSSLEIAIFPFDTHLRVHPCVHRVHNTSPHPVVTVEGLHSLRKRVHSFYTRIATPAMLRTAVFPVLSQLRLYHACFLFQDSATHGSDDSQFTLFT